MNARLAVSIATRIDTRGVEEFVADQLAPSVQRAAGAVRDYAKDNLIAAGRVDIGTLLRGVTAETSKVRGREVVARVVSEQPCARFIHDGTRGPIRPRRARVLRFVGRSGAMVYTPTVKGISATPYLTDALKQVKPSDFA